MNAIKIKKRILTVSLTVFLAMVFCAFSMVSETQAEEGLEQITGVSEADNQSVKANAKTGSKATKSTKSQTSKPKQQTSASKKTTSSGTKKSSSAQKKSGSKSSKKSSQNKKSKSKDIRNAAAERESNSAGVMFSEEEIERYRAMPFETWESPREISEIGFPIEPGFAQPYPYGNLMRQFCGGTKRKLHRGHDIGLVGETNGGLGTVINSVTRSVITLIGKTGEDIGEFGKQDKRTGETVRTGKKYPRQILVPGYGVVYPFSLNYGRWRSGVVIVTKVLDGPLKDYTIRYMHMAAVRPDLKVGDVVEAGEHIALMGATAVMDSHPHVHIDMSTPTGTRADLAPYIGISAEPGSCRAAQKASKSKASSKKSSNTPKKGSTKKSSKSSTKKSSKSSTPKKRSRSSYTTQNTVTEPPNAVVLERTV